MRRRHEQQDENATHYGETDANANDNIAADHAGVSSSGQERDSTYKLRSYDSSSWRQDPTY